MFFQTKAFLTKKSQKKRFFYFQRKLKVLKKSQNFKIWLQKTQIGNPAKRRAGRIGLEDHVSY